MFQACAEMLQENTSLQSLNIESNFITSDGMMAIIKAMANNATLVELKIDNQVWKTKLEMRMYCAFQIGRDVWCDFNTCNPAVVVRHIYDYS